MKARYVLAILASLTINGCSRLESASSASDVIAHSNVMGDPNGTYTGTITQPGTSTGSTTGTINQPGTGGTASQGTATAPSGSIPVSLVCSDKGSQETVSFQAAVAAGDTIDLDVNGQVCTSDVATITSLLEAKTISVSSLETLCPSAVPTSGTVALTLLINGQQQSDTYNMGKGLTVIWDTNPQTSKSTSAAQQYCTTDASPLVIHIAQNPAVSLPLNLSPTNAVLFDLLGQTDNHQKVLIPWFTNLDYRLLALPNGNGEVLGIDQLFGNNTTGPDGLTAANGYAALAKYDGMSADGKVRIAPADGQINKNDPVYPLLRVWLDKNFDGIVQPDELVSLESVHIDSIALNYSSSYPEVDAYGDEIRMKSVVQLSTGGLDLIFDLWFRYTTP